MSKNFQPYFVHIIFFKKPNKQIYTRAKELYFDATIFVFWFFIVYLPKKMETEKWSKAADSPLYFVHRGTVPKRRHVIVATYADNTAILAAHRDPETACRIFQRQLFDF